MQVVVRAQVIKSVCVCVWSVHLSGLLVKIKQSSFVDKRCMCVCVLVYLCAIEHVFFPLSVFLFVHICSWVTVCVCVCWTCLAVFLSVQGTVRQRSLVPLTALS